MNTLLSVINYSGSQDDIVWQEENLRLEKYALYRDLFVGFGAAMAEAGYQIDEPEPSAVQELWKAADTDWVNATGSQALDSNKEWTEAAKAAEWRGKPGDIASARDAIFRWAYGKVSDYLSNKYRSDLQNTD